jgi:hypothetical protein
MKCDINGVKVEGSVEEIIEILSRLKSEGMTIKKVAAAPNITLEPVPQKHGLSGQAWSPERRKAFAKIMTESWARRNKAKVRRQYSRNAPVWSEVNKNKILPPPLAEMGSIYKTAWSKEKVLSKLARPHGNDFDKANTDFDALMASGTIQETKNGRFRVPFGVTRMV